MADGTHTPIQDIRVGDWVQSKNEATGEVEAKQVTATTAHRTMQTVSVALTDPHTHKTQQIVCTPNHPFYVAGQGFTPAGSLGIGTSIVTRAGPSLAVSNVQPQAAAAQGTMVYNLTVEGDHTYFVGTLGGGAWVHNANKCGQGMRGNAETRELDRRVAQFLRDRNWDVTHGAENDQECIKDPDWQRNGKRGRPKNCVFPDLTANKDGVILRIQTVDTENGRMDDREQENFNKILQRRPNDILIAIPKK